MSKCKECANYYPLADGASRGDCVRRVTDERQSYNTAKPTIANRKSDDCTYLVGKDNPAGSNPSLAGTN